MPERSRGSAIIGAIVILVILAALAGFIVSVSTTQEMTIAQDFQSSRALQAARIGIEWSTSNWLASGTCAGTSLTFADPNLSSFTTTVTVASTTAGGVNFCTITSAASPTGAAVGSLGYVERRLQAVVEGN